MALERYVFEGVPEEVVEGTSSAKCRPVMARIMRVIRRGSAPVSVAATGFVLVEVGGRRCRA